jgi:tRNA dimethylallyltransferase
MLQGLSEIPEVPEVVRTRIRAGAEGQDAPVLHAQLLECDPLTAARLKPNDRQRILRALEVFAASGLSITSFHTQRGAPLIDGARCRCIFLAPGRAELYARIDRRFDAMIAQGALVEVRAMAARNLDPALPAMRAHGVPGLLACLKGQMTLAEAIAKGQLDTRHYSKRQFTWFRHQLPQFEWVTPEMGQEAVLASG